MKTVLQNNVFILCGYIFCAEGHFTMVHWLSLSLKMYTEVIKCDVTSCKPTILSMTRWFGLHGLQTTALYIYCTVLQDNEHRWNSKWHQFVSLPSLKCLQEVVSHLTQNFTSIHYSIFAWVQAGDFILHIEMSQASMFSIFD